MSTSALKKLTIAFGILLLLAVSQFVIPNLSGSGNNEYRKKTESVNAASISSIEFSKGSGKLLLKKDNGVWKAGDKRADSTKVEDLLAHAVTSPDAELSAQTNTRHKELEVTDDMATKIKFTDSLTILAGKSSIEGTFVRLSGSDPVYMIKNLVTSDISTSSADWYDKTIVRIEEKDISKVEVESGAEKYSLVKKDSVWKVEEGNKDVDTAKMSALTTALMPFTANSVADKETVAKYPSVQSGSLTVHTGNSKQVVRFFKGESDYLVKREGDGENFVVSEFKVNDLLIPQTNILAK